MAQCARAIPEVAVLLTVKADIGLANSDPRTAGRHDLELFWVDAAPEGCHRFQSAGRVGNVEQIMAMLCSRTLPAN